MILINIMFYIMYISIFMLLTTKGLDYINDNFFYKYIVETRTGEIIKLSIKKFNILLENKDIEWDKKMKMWVMKN